MRYPAISLLLSASLNLMSAEPPPSNAAWLNALPPVPEFMVSDSLEAWDKQRTGIRVRLWNVLGDLPPRPPMPQVTTLKREQREGYSLERFEFDNGAGETVRGYMFVPDGVSATKKAPAILYCHWHGGQYDLGKEEMLLANATPEPPGPALAREGYVVMGIDACGFGERNGKGPDGPEQKGSAGEMTAAKFNLWAGRTLWGMVVRDDLMALDYLASRPEVDASRIGVTGISMGSTRAWWLMALDDRPKTAVCVACMTRYQDLIQAGMLKAHGIYYYVPGMLKHFDTEAVIACAAPRPMLFMTGDEDAGSPVSGVKKINAVMEKLYALHAADHEFESIIYPGVGHVYLPEMWERTKQWFGTHLK